MSSAPFQFCYPLEQQPPKLGPGGSTRGASVREFPASVGLAGVSMRLAPGGMRELHWHPNADEWQYYISGTAEMTVFLAQGQAVTELFAAGDVGYVPMGAGHYIKNTGSEVCRLLLGFNSGYYQAIDLSNWLASNPQALLAGNFGISAELAAKLPAAERFMVPPAAEPAPSGPPGPAALGRTTTSFTSDFNP